MKSNMKKAVSVALASAMVLSMASCSFLDKSKDEVLDAADEYAKNLASCSVSKLAKLSGSDFEDIQEDWEAKLTFSEGDLYNADTAAALDAIADTLSYEVDEESAEATKKSGEGSVDVTFKIADYEDLLDNDEISDAAAFADAVAEADTKEISITLEFEADDDTWLCSNYEDVFGDLYAFTDEEFSFVPAIADALTADNLHWYFTDNYDDTAPAYTNAEDIDAELPIDLTSGVDLTGVTCEMTYNGQVIFSNNDTYDCWVEAADVDSQYLDSTGSYFAAGQYTITFYNADGSEIMSGTCTVSVEEVVTAASNELEEYVGYIDDTEADPTFLAGIGDIGWYDSDYGYYDSGVSVIEFTVERTDATMGDLTYEYYYSADGSSANSTYVGSFTCSTVSYTNGDFYECQYTGTIADGYYIIFVSYNGVDQLSACCRVG